MRAEELARLRQLGELVLERDLAQLRQNARTLAANSLALGRIAGARTHRIREMAEGGEADAARAAGADNRWWEWGDETILQLNRDRAACAAERETLMVAARRALGRRGALAALAKRQAEAREKGRRL